MNARYALTILRVFLGVIFAVAVWPKLPPGFEYRLAPFLTGFAMQNGHPFYRAFLSSVVLPHISVFATLIKAGETCVAIGLITGTATRVAGVVAMFLVTNYMFAKGLWWWTPSSNDAADFMIALALVIGRAGRTLGIDAWLARRWPKAPFW